MSEIVPTDREQNSLSRIFFGRDGLRAGWSLLTALVLFLSLMWGLSTLLRVTNIVPAHGMEHAPGPLHVFLAEGAAFLSIALVTVIMSRVEHRPLAVYGLGGSRKAWRILSGVVTGLLAIALLVFLLFKSGLLVIDQRLLFGSDVARYLLLWVPGFFAIGFFEEYLFRGYLQYTLARGLTEVAHRLPGDPDPHTVGFWIAAVVVSFGFGAVHGSNPGESPAGLVCAGAASLVFCFSLWRTGSLWWAVGLHAAWDYGQSVLFGVSDSGALFGHRLLQTHPVGAPILSGGATGPEGSIFCLIPLLLLIAVIHLSQRRTEEIYALQMPPLSALSASAGEALPPDPTPTP